MYLRSVVRSIAHYKINVVVKVLIISDFIFWSSYQLFAPFFAIFVEDKIKGGSVEVIGIASALYLICKSLFEIPVGMYIDRSKSEKDDLYSAFLGTFLIGIIYLAYLFIYNVWQLYLLQIIMGIASAISYPGWCAIFTRHIDKGKEGFEWSLYDILSGIGMAVAAALGGFIIASFGFNTLFILIAIISIISSFLLLVIKNRVYKK